MRPYTEIPGFGELVLEESFVLDISATPGRLVLSVEFALTPDHPAYTPPRPDENEAYRRGEIRFLGVRRLVWEGQGARPATDASGETDYGHIDDLRWDDGIYDLEGDWGRISIEAGSVEAEL